MLRVYCDTGAFRSELSGLERRGAIQVYQFKYENKNRKIIHRASPSNPTWEEAKYTWKELGSLSWNDMGRQSERWADILRLIGNNNTVDAKHLDSAYMIGCQVFLTSDKDDIVTHSRSLEKLLGLKVFHYREGWIEFLSFLAAEGKIFAPAEHRSASQGVVG